ncbi:hypothetical protein PHJA_001498300 [Phtheirospermum japonicum]|uniref:Mitochondrial ATPase complex subunit ATP10 n=1 Tax=Phtheirospermum japonicum TaxID=374723 RepID=A0A830C3A8_9LAMI|nr:hypothetical protein PHJA_001498300 [Phtheirospermum japonicum]
MLRFKKLFSVTPRHLSGRNLCKEDGKLFPTIPVHNPSQLTSTRFLDIYQMGNKAAIEKERARLKDEMSRGYFADMSEMKQNAGKIAMANKIIIPSVAAVKFPALEVNYSDGSTLKLPITSSDKNDVHASKSDIPKASLVCLSFRASSQPMVDSWSLPFLNTFANSSDARLYEVSFIDSWLLTRSPIKKLLLKIMRKSKPGEKQDILQRQIVYSFGDHYYFRKELKILNLLTGYIFLVDKLGRIRWQGFGLATEDELLSLLSCTSLLLDEK